MATPRTAKKLPTKRSVSKRSQTAASSVPIDPPPAGGSTGAYVTAHYLPGVYTNVRGDVVDERGVLLSFAELKRRDAQHQADAAPPEGASSPLDYMERCVWDPRLPTALRLRASESLAQYRERKMPQAIEGPTPGSPVQMAVTTKAEATALAAVLAGLSKEQQAQFLALATPGVKSGG